MSTLNCENNIQAVGKSLWVYFCYRVASKDLIVTGGLDSLVKLWVCQNNRLEIKDTLEGHTMGVVSVAINPCASSKYA